jgi:hypothetical protein
VSRERTRDHNLPRRLYRHGHSFRLVHPDGRKINLGRDEGEAIRRYTLLMTPPQPPLPPMLAADVWRRHMRGAKQRGIEFALTMDDAQALLDAGRSRCAVTELPFSMEKPEGLRIRPWAPSIDRIDGRRGYVPGNVRMVCAFVNVAMNGFGERLFLTVLRSLVQAGVAAELHRIGVTPISRAGNLTGLAFPAALTRENGESR